MMLNGCWFEGRPLCVGDLLTRDGTDIQRVVEIIAYDAIVVECVRAPRSGWVEVGETETNLVRRYVRWHLADEKYDLWETPAAAAGRHPKPPANRQ